jgi:hypothetical protein
MGTLKDWTIEDLETAIEALNETVAEDRNEEALFGDGPFGSSDRERELHRYLAELDRRQRAIS